MVIATTGHLDLCRPYIQTAIDTLNNPEVLMMYGFFSNHPPNGALAILDHYHSDPLVLAHLPDMLRFAARKRGSMDSYWYPIVEYPHRIIVKIGPKALGPLEAFCRAERAYYARIKAGDEPVPAWWREDTIEKFAEWRREMGVTAELVRCLHGKKPPKDALGVLCSVYLSSRPWGAWERQKIRDRITELRVDVLPLVEEELAPRTAALRAEFDKQIAARQAAADAETERRKKAAIKKEVEAVKVRKAELNQRVAELNELAALVRLFHARKPSAADVPALCRFYVKRPWGNQYSFIKDNCSYTRPLYDKQLALTRDTLQRWGGAALPALRAFIETDKQALAKALAELDKDEEYWKPQWSRKSTMPLARIAQEREDIQRISAGLRDLAQLIEIASEDRLSREQVGELCRIYTRRAWAGQNALIRKLLKRAGAGAVPAIRQHVRSEKEALPGIVAEVEGHMSNSVKVRVKWRYDRACALAANVRRGIEELGTIARTIQ
jgi:hypothetical protein